MDKDYSWLQNMSEIGLVTLGFFGVAALFIWKGLPLILAHHEKLGIAKIESSKGILSEQINTYLVKIKETLANDRAEVDKKLYKLTMLVYADFIYNEDRDIDDRMEMLIDYLKAGYNGVVLEWAINKFIVAHKTEWIKALNKDKDKQPDNKYYQECLAEIKRRVMY